MIRLLLILLSRQWLLVYNFFCVFCSLLGLCCLWWHDVRFVSNLASEPLYFQQARNLAASQSGYDHGKCEFAYSVSVN